MGRHDENLLQYLKPSLNEFDQRIFSFQLFTEFYQNQFSLLVPQF